MMSHLEDVKGRVSTRRNPVRSSTGGRPASHPPGEGCMRPPGSPTALSTLRHCQKPSRGPCTTDGNLQSDVGTGSAWIPGNAFDPGPNTVCLVVGVRVPAQRPSRPSHPNIQIDAHEPLGLSPTMSATWLPDAFATIFTPVAATVSVLFALWLWYRVSLIKVRVWGIDARLNAKGRGTGCEAAPPPQRHQAVARRAPGGSPLVEHP